MAATVTLIRTVPSGKVVQIPGLTMARARMFAEMMLVDNGVMSRCEATAWLKPLVIGEPLIHPVDTAWKSRLTRITRRTRARTTTRPVPQVSQGRPATAWVVVKLTAHPASRRPTMNVHAVSLLPGALRCGLTSPVSPVPSDDPAPATPSPAVLAPVRYDHDDQHPCRY